MRVVMVACVVVVGVLLGLASLAAANPDEPFIGTWVEPGTGGVVLRRVHIGGPGHVAGLRDGDVVAKVDGITVDKPPAFVTAIDRKRPGDSVKLDVLRGKKARTIDVVLGRTPSRPEIFAMELRGRPAPRFVTHDGVFPSKGKVSVLLLLAGEDCPECWSPVAEARAQTVLRPASRFEVEVIDLHAQCFRALDVHCIDHRDAAMRALAGELRESLTWVFVDAKGNVVDVVAGTAPAAVGRIDELNRIHTTKFTKVKTLQKGDLVPPGRGWSAQHDVKDDRLHVTVVNFTKLRLLCTVSARTRLHDGSARTSQVVVKPPHSVWDTAEFDIPASPSQDSWAEPEDEDWVADPLHAVSCRVD